MKKEKLGSELQIGQIAKVIAIITEDKKIKKRLLDMGFTPGVWFSIKKKAPLGDPIDIEIRGYELCLRLRDLRWIVVEV